MDVAARLTSKRQLMVPKVVRDALGIEAGDQVIFRIEGHRATLSRTRDFLDLAGTIEVPASKRSATWDDVIRKTRTSRAARHRSAHSSTRMS